MIETFKREPNLSIAVIALIVATITLPISTTIGFPLLAAGLASIAIHFLRLSSVREDIMRRIVKQGINERDQLIKSCNDMGLTFVYRSRKDAFEPFWSNYVKTLEKEETVEIVGISLRGRENTSTDFVKRISEQKKRGLNFLILLTHPQYSRIRARQERPNLDKEPSKKELESIGGDIIETLKLMTQSGIQDKCIKFYKGVPTAFIIATPKHMLVQMYPTQARETSVLMFTFTAEKDTDGIYEEIHEKNIKFPWSDQILSETYDSSKIDQYEKLVEEEIRI